MIITIDGPTASGKSTVATGLAHELGFYYLNSGFLYRAISYLLMSKFGYTLDRLQHPRRQDLEVILDPSRFSYIYKDGKAGVLYDGTAITSHLKTELNDQASSIVSQNPLVREALRVYQRQITQNHDVIAEGRDTGTVVFPQADIKFFLTASPEERARRWQKEQAAQGFHYNLDEARQQVEERDARDSKRVIAPLMVPSGAVVIDNTNLSKEQTISKLYNLVKSLSAS